MNDLFGLSMTYIMIGLLAVLALAVSTVGWVLLRNRVLFFIGVRNIPRRRAQTILIIIGLMLSTLIISTAFSIGDTVDYSITNQAYDTLHSIDEVVQAQASDTDEQGNFASASLVSARPIPNDQAAQLVQKFKAVPGVDGAVKVIRGPVPVSDQRSGQNESNVVLVGADASGMQGFETDIMATDGRQLSLADLGPDEIYANKSAADKLDIQKGDTLQVFVGGKPNNFTVKEIVDDRVLTGSVAAISEGLALSLSRAQQLFGRPNDIDLIAVSNNGGVHDGIKNSAAIKNDLNTILAGTPYKATSTKKDLVDSASEAASFLTTFFVVLGLFAISAGMMLIFLIFVMLAAERRVEMGMIRAVGTKRRHLIQMFMSEGMAYNMMAAAVGCALGIVVSLVMVQVMAILFKDFGLTIAFHVSARSLIVSYSLGVVLTFVTVTFSSWRISNLNIVAAIRELSDSTTKYAGKWALRLGTVCVIVGSLFIWLAFSAEKAFPFGVGWTLVLVGSTQVARFFRVPNRLAFTTMGVVLLVSWLLLAGGRLFPNLDGGIEMFFLSGVTMILSSTFVLVYNADLMLGTLTAVGGIFSSLIPSIRTAVAYPLANKFRTGMTIAMISLVMFALVMMSTMNSNFSRIYLGNDALGGYDVIVQENPNNHIDSVAAALQSNGGNGPADAAAIVSESGVRQANSRVAEVRMAPLAATAATPAAAAAAPPAEATFSKYTILGPTADFLKDNGVKLASRAEGMTTDAEVWGRLATDPNTAVIDDNALGGGGFGGGDFSISGVKRGDKTFKPVTVQVRDATAPEGVKDVQIIGIIGPKGSGIYQGLYLAPQTFDAVFPHPESTIHLLKTQPGVDSDRIAKNIEKDLLNQGVQADSLRKLIDTFQAQSRGFLYLIQGFMGIGLFVGIAAVGVIAFRTVVERRQQIGMLRAIGYTRNAVAISFVMESSFVSLLGVLSGIGLALLLAYQLLSSDDFASSGIDGFYVPWPEELKGFYP